MELSPKLNKFLLSTLAVVIAGGTGMASSMTSQMPKANAKRVRTQRMVSRWQKGSALAPYSTRYSYVRNQNLYRETFKYNRNNSIKTPVNYWKGKPYYNFHPFYQFNVNTDPQSMVIKPNGMMYILYSDEDGYDNVVKTHVHRNIDRPYGTVAQDFGTVGPAYPLGHGQSLAYNPHTDTMWMLTNTKGGYKKYTSAVQINQSTLKPEYQIKFKFSNNLKIGAALTFDKYGNAYTCAKTFGGAAKKNSLKIFKGYVNRHGVHFHLVQQLVMHAPGHVLQNMSYNPRNNRLYVVTDGAIMSFPANRVGHLRPKDVKDTTFRGRREFEQVGFNGNRGYLLVNSPEAVEKSTRAF